MILDLACALNNRSVIFDDALNDSKLRADKADAMCELNTLWGMLLRPRAPAP